jgi:hypothetical protein
MKGLGARITSVLVGNLALIVSLFLVVGAAIFVATVFRHPEWFLSLKGPGTPNSLTYGIPNFLPEDRLAGKEARSTSPTPDHYTVRNCRAKAISGVTLLLTDCATPHLAAVVSLNVIPAPTDAAQKALSELVQGILVDCDSGGNCTAHRARITCPTCTVNLSESLLTAGLAVLPLKVEKAFDAMSAAQLRAKQGRRGLWWDWSETQKREPDPVIWRAERDSTLANAEGAQVSRAQVLGSYVSGTLTLLLGALFGNYLFGKLGKISEKQRIRDSDKRRMSELADSIDSLLKAFHLSTTGEGVSKALLSRGLESARKDLLTLTEKAGKYKDSKTAFHGFLDAVGDYIHQIDELVKSLPEQGVLTEGDRRPLRVYLAANQRVITEAHERLSA